MRAGDRCQCDILRVERVTREQSLYISPATLQSFKCMARPGLLPHRARMSGSDMHLIFGAQLWRTCRRMRRRCGRAWQAQTASRRL